MIPCEHVCTLRLADGHCNCMLRTVHSLRADTSSGPPTSMRTVPPTTWHITSLCQLGELAVAGKIRLPTRLSLTRDSDGYSVVLHQLGSVALQMRMAHSSRLVCPVRVELYPVGDPSNSCLGPEVVKTLKFLLEKCSHVWHCAQHFLLCREF